MISDEEATVRSKTGGSKPIRQLDKDVYQLAKDRTKEVMERFDHVAVSFSGGKDSTCVLNIALEVAHENPELARKHLPLRVVFFDEEAVAPPTIDYVRRVYNRPDVNLEWYCIPIVHRNSASRKSPYWSTWAPEDEHKWCRPMPPEAMPLKGLPTEIGKRVSIPDASGLLAPPELGNVALLLGIRAQESMTRTRAVRRKSGDNYIIAVGDSQFAKGNLWKAYPIYDWKTEDVWTAPATKGWDYNRTYEFLEMMGISRAEQRCSPPFGEEPLGTIKLWSHCFPELWDKMVERVPGVGAGLRYARTELWAFGSVPEKPVGQSWPDFLVGYVAQFPAPERKKISERIQQMITLHYRKTTMPLLVKNRHPVTGVSWNFLLRMAMRGDFKQRNTPTTSIVLDENNRPQAKYWHRYVCELREIIDEGQLGEIAYTGPLPADLNDFIPNYAKDQTA